MVAVTKHVPELLAVRLEPDKVHVDAVPVLTVYVTLPAVEPPLVARLKAVSAVPLVVVTVKAD